jgi:hypothetical protein
MSRRFGTRGRRGGTFGGGGGVSIPQAQALLWRKDPRLVTASPVDAWPSTVGTFSPTAAGGARPTWDGTSVTFDGTDDALTVATSAAIHPSGATKFSLLAWVYPVTPTATAGIVLETGTYPNSIQLQFSTLALDIFVGAAGARWPAVPTAGVWTALCATYDGSRALGSRMRLFVGAPTVVEVTPTSDAVAAAALPAASGTARLGGRTGGWYPGKEGDILLWNGVELTAAEFQQVVNATNY